MKKAFGIQTFHYLIVSSIILFRKVMNAFIKACFSLTTHSAFDTFYNTIRHFLSISQKYIFSKKLCDFFNLKDKPIFVLFN